MPLSAKSINFRPLIAGSETLADCLQKALPVILSLILALIVLMAVTSGFNRHPDEKHHFDAASYYVHHWLPPQVGAPEAADSYSKYGASYINELDLVYFLAGKFSLCLSPVIARPYLAMRFFNVFLFLLLVLYCMFNPDSRFILLCVLISSQVWYVFSYFNNDAISLFISLIIVSEILSRQSLSQTLLRSAEQRQVVAGVITLGMLLGILFLCKKNYYTFILFLFFIIAWQIWQNRGPFQRQLLLRYLAVAGIGFSLFFVRYGYDVAINGWNKSERMAAYAEKMAAPEYKPSLAASSASFYGLHLRAKGLKYAELFSKWEWQRISFRSFFGVYDYMLIFSSRNYYNLVFYVLSVFLSYLTLSVLIKGGWQDRIFIILVWGFMALAILVSSLHSWINDFQAQGRYLFPVLGMLGTLLYQHQKIWQRGPVAVLVLMLCGLAAYSFIFTGLANLMTVGLFS